MKQSEMPVGFAMALAMNPKAMQTFSSLSEDRQQAIIEGTHSIKSKEEMHRYVDALVNSKNEF